MSGILLLLLVLLLCILDVVKKLDISRGGFLALYLAFMPHLPFFLIYLWINPFDCLFPFNRTSLLLLIAGAVIWQLYSTLRLHFFPFRKNESGIIRIGILYGGQLLVEAGILGMLLLILYYGICLAFFPGFLYGLGTHYFIFDMIYSLIFVWLFLANGSIRILCTCRRLGIIKRLIICLTLWIPPVNIFFTYYMCRVAKDEYALETFRAFSNECRKESYTCATKYPIIMVHGIGFRDLKYFNYWGRMPKVLSCNGASVYYGHQKAWGTIEENAALMKENIEHILTETGAKKVNIIAHSKGGLDSRYMITKLGMADKVASLTTVSTPHHGSRLIDFLNRLPDGIYRLIAHMLDKSFQMVGDENPDCYHSSKQLAPAFCSEFNSQVPDCKGIYYQSYTSVMRNMFSDSLLSIPYLLMCFLDTSDNDGLVSVDSAKWGTFKGVFQNKKRRGISHGDMIDLKREDYNGFDVIEEYIKIVEELKGMGY